MLYYEVLVSSQRYHGKGALTYSFEEKLEVGSIVTVPLQKIQVLGVVTKAVKKPLFAAKPIIRTQVAGAVPTELLELYRWISVYYPAPSGVITQLFLPSLLSQKSRHDYAKSTENISKELPPLTPEQLQAVQSVLSSEYKSAILHGDTGTGKTRVYQELIKMALDKGRSSIVLTPEIGLTPQLSATLEKSFPGRVITMHSNLTDAQRRNAWLHILQQEEPLVVIGPRSALFTPLRNVGVIIIDEAHDSAYKQEQLPYYQATRVAAKLASLHNAQLILGTATPPISDYYMFESKKLPIIRMCTPAIQSNHAITEPLVVDLREKENFPRSPWLSIQLLESIEAALRNSQQSLVFLNRRGSARLVLCQKCGWQATCPRCDLPLTYHGDTHRVQCHTCGFADSAPTSCESCSSADIVFRSIGTKSIVEELKRLFPKAVIQRFDSDNTKADSLEEQYEDVKNGKFDIIVGTQMLSKGLDLPGLTVVGIVVADTGLYFPDFTAEERTYQMLSQVIGRVGRGHNASQVIVQTYHPDSATIQAAITKNYPVFYEQQLAERKMFGFPPFRYVLKLSCRRATSKSASQNAEKLVDMLRTQNLVVEIVGPSPAFTERTNNQFNWQIVVKSTRRSELTRVIDLLPAGWTYDIDPSNLL